MQCGNCGKDREVRQVLFEKDGRVLDTTFLCTGCLGRLRWDADCIFCGRGEWESKLRVKHEGKVGGRRLSDLGGACIRCGLRLRADEVPEPTRRARG